MTPMRLVYLTAAWFLLCCHAIQAGVFVTPLGGTPFQDWSIGNYVDLNPGSGILDYHGGDYTYDGHDAIDFGIDTFPNMNKNLPVLAAAAGTVISVVDGHYDHNYTGHILDYQANYVTIDHGNGLITNYYHLMKNSIDVSVGQVVAAGQQLGFVGSSGNSSGPHLHFSVYQNGNVVETYQNPSYWWTSPLPYAGTMPCSLAHGLTDHNPNESEVYLTGVTPVSVFEPNDLVAEWTTLHGIKDGSLDYYFDRPDGSEQAHWHWNINGEINGGWWNGSLGLGSNPMLGQWNVFVKYNGNTLVQDSFMVVPEPSTIVLLGSGAFGLLAFTWRRRNRIGL